MSVARHVEFTGKMSHYEMFTARLINGNAFAAFFVVSKNQRLFAFARFLNNLMWLRLLYISFSDQSMN